MEIQECIDTRPTWDQLFFTEMLLYAQRSADPSSQVGCVITTPDNVIVSGGYNNPIRGVDLQQKWVQDNITKRPDKYMWMEHAERNAIYNANRLGRSVMGSTLYILAMPCTDCCRAICQSGVARIKLLKETSDLWKLNPNWKDAHEPAVQMFGWAGVEVETIATKLIVPIPVRISGKTYIIGHDAQTENTVSNWLTSQSRSADCCEGYSH